MHSYVYIFQPGGNLVKIEHRKLEWNATPRTKALNSGYVPGGGDKKVSFCALETETSNSSVC